MSARMDFDRMMTMVFLLENGAKDEAVRTSTYTLARMLLCSQQTASRHLISLREDGLARCTGKEHRGSRNRYQVTEKGLDVIRALGERLLKAVE